MDCFSAIVVLQLDSYRAWVVIPNIIRKPFVQKAMAPAWMHQYMKCNYI